MPQTIFCANGSAGDKVEIPVAAVQKSLPKRRESAEKVEIPVAAVRKSLPKRRKSAEKVEIPVVAIRESLPKRRKSAEKVENPVAAVRESLPKRRKSAEKVENPVTAVRKSLPKQRKNGRKGRDSHYRHPEISTQIAEKRRSFNKIKKRTGKSALIVKRQKPASYFGGKGLFKKRKICKKIY